MPDPSNEDLLAKLIQHDAALAADAAELRHLSSRIDEIAEVVGGHTELFRQVIEILEGHSALLQSHDSRLTRLEGLVVRQGEQLERLEELVAGQGQQLAGQGVQLAAIIAALDRIEAQLGNR